MRRPAYGNQPEWSGHAVVVGAALTGGEQGESQLLGGVGEDEELLLAAERDGADRIALSFKLLVNASDPVPAGVVRQDGYLVEFMQKPLPYTCMAVAMAELATGSALLQEMVLNGVAPAIGRRTPSTTQAREESDSLAWHTEARPAGEDLAVWRLNMPQEAAIRGALEEQLLLVHGPPGTGKTKTAATLAVIFALQNVKAASASSVLYCTPSNDAADVACLRVADISVEHFKGIADIRSREADEQECVICFSGGCDVVTSCCHLFHASCLARALATGNRGCPLCRRPLRAPGGGLSALRIYSAEMERTDFPVPKRIDHPSARPRQPRTVPTYMREYAWHWRCHGVAPGVAPTPEAIAAGDAYRRLLQAGTSSPDFTELRSEYYFLLAEARAAELQRADVVFATCITSRRASLAEALRAEGARDLKQVIVDEAGQSPEPETLCPLTLAKGAQRLVLVGDPKQLRPIIRSPAAQRLGLGISLLERLSRMPRASPRLLSVQYRMHPALNAFPSAYFYENRVRTADSVLSREAGLLVHPRWPSYPAPLLFWATSSMASEQLSHVRTAESSARSRFHPAEAERAASLARALAGRVGGGQVAVLSWYNAQVKHMAKLLTNTGVHVGGVVTSQGNEWDYVILSTVRSAKGGLGVLSDEHLLDVALTRARRGLCILGSPHALQNSAGWAALLQHCYRQGAITQEQPQLISHHVRRQTVH
eukprot:gnl/TRDRNA2_/TRDRNA2_144005_c1_seq1.p1 gnl/TRDRNA2_/TRDRNA2_144005_c1~~gnl/TRDRNA2_/TRDRNA2_144005_c1_seq1.p1  ORF type:complete len:780 (+),score=106.69 gnl/TRDRNA2_/TRDRNA2_144005_c1_seq1:209-2341(+)